MTFSLRPAQSVGYLLCAIVACVPLPALAQGDFDQQREAVAASTVTQSEAAILSLLRAGLAEEKPTQAYAVVERWLRENVANDPMLLYHAGQAAEFSGDWSAAIAHYRQYLRRADLKSDTAADAIIASYTRQINDLDAPEAAYAFSRAEGHGLVASHAGRQFDRWFLEEAKRRGDFDAIAQRLLALIEANVEPDLLTVHYADDASWLLHHISSIRLDETDLSSEFVETVNSIANSDAFDEEFRLRLAWKVSVKHYTSMMMRDEQAEAPIAEATALLAKFPDAALEVQIDWAGSTSRHYRGDWKKYWPVDQEAKLAPVVEAVKKLDPAQQVRFYRSWGVGYFDGGPEILEPEEARAWVVANPKIANEKTGPNLRFDWNKLTAEQAKELAPKLEQNPSEEAALVRAVASAFDGEEKNLDKAVDTLLKTETWRLDPNRLPGYIDQLWHWAGRPDGNAKRDQLIARAKPLQQEAKAAALKKEDPANKRLGEFKRLWNDYRSNQPKITNVRARLKSALQVTPEAINELLRDNSIEGRKVLREALEAGFQGTDPGWVAYESAPRVSTRNFSPAFDELVRRHYGGLGRLMTVKEKYRPHPLADTFQQLLESQLKQNKVDTWVVYAWLNTRFPEDNEKSVALMEQLRKSSAWDDLSFVAQVGARKWFAAAAMSPQEVLFFEAADRDAICEPLTSLAADADAAAVASAIEKALENLRESPVRHEPLGLENLGALPQEVLADPAVTTLLVELIASLRPFETDVNFGTKLFGVVNAGKDPATLHRTGAYLWRHTQVHHRTHTDLISLADAMVGANASVASGLAREGLETMARHKRGHTWFNRDADFPRLNNIRGRAAIEMKLIEIPVRPSHPAYPIYQSQSEFLIGNEGSARQLYSANADQLLPVHRQLTVEYLLWVLQHTIANREEDRQESIVSALNNWAEESATAFSPEQRIALRIAYGDIALQRSMLPEAERIYRAVSNDEAFESVFKRHEATLRVVRVQRIAKDYDGALQTLLELDSEKVPSLTTAAHYARAEVYYDMGDFEDADDEIDEVLQREPDHADATLLRGRVQLKLERLIEATEVELGAVTAQASLVPGEMLKVTLNDPTLSVSSGATDIEVEVWATSGDREVLLLRQFGDQKTKYRGEVRTALGEPSADDGTLQVIGDDEVYYAYSERFRQRMPDVPESRSGPITIASDALMMASARKLLSENQQRAADLEAATAALDRGHTRNLESREPEKYRRLLAEAAERARRDAIQTRVKPGNPIYVRVIDPDRSRTAEIDDLAVTVSTSSGDSIGRVVLEETKTHSGQFEGQITTTSAQAMAFATSSEPGRNPNMVISPNTSYPGWRPDAGAEGGHRFHVDLNDNVEIDKLNIVASDDGFALRKFVVETAMNETNWTPVAIFPTNPIAIAKPWHPSVLVMNDTDRHHNNNDRSVYDLDELQAHVNSGWITQQFAAGVADNVAGPSEAFTPEIPGRVEWKRQGRHHNSHVVYRFRGYFYEPADVTRRFKLDMGKFEMPKMHPSVAHPAQFLLAVNGRPITSAEKPEELVGEINLRAGVHRFEIWATGWDGRIGFGRPATLLANLNDGEEWVECPDSFFDPSTFPTGVLDHRNAPGTVTGTDNGKSFSVDFAEGSRARLIRIRFVENEAPVPSLNRLTLIATSGDAVLPVPQDFAELRKNDQLEIITGDEITVRYVDDRYVTKSKQQHERFLQVEFTDATAEFADVEPRLQRGSIKPYHERLLRFVHDKPLSVIVRDADMDESIEPDKIKVILTNEAGDRRELTAVETEDSSGTFRAWITPVEGSTDAADQIQVPAGGALTLTYMDRENLSPGVPIERSTAIRHAPITEPKIEIAHMDVSPIDFENLPADSALRKPQSLNERLLSRFDPLYRPNDRETDDLIFPSYQITQTYLAPDESTDGEIEVVHGQRAMIDIYAPHVALGTASNLKVYLQTDSGRRAAGNNASGTFDLNVPGTLQLDATINAGSVWALPPMRGGYLSTFAEERGSDYQRMQESQNLGRFRLAVPLIPGPTPTESYADPEAFYEKYRGTGIGYPQALVTKTGERIHIGVSYTDASGQKQWATASAKVVTRPMLDVMQEDYREPRTAAHVGENLHLRVVDLAEDRTDDRDSVRVYMMSREGEKHYAILRETDVNTGVFKGVFQLTYTKAQDQAEVDAEEGYDVGRLGFPVVYGDAVGIRYTDASERKTPVRFVEVAKGSDGSIAPFSKRYDDKETAMETQFAMAESFLELARRYRALDNEEAAARQFERARQLLASTIAQFNDPETRAHAEYLLGNLTMEDAEIADDEQLQSDRYHAALARFMKVTGTYEKSEWASMAQFKVAVIYERLGEPDIAAQEYVKLAYKYPDSVHLATAMARLGTHFQRKAVLYERQAKPLMEDPENKDAMFEGEALTKLARAEYIKSAQIFERLRERFPSHELAGKAGLRSGQIYMRAQDYSAAIRALKGVIDDEAYDGPTLRAEAMYWAGMCQTYQKESMLAYALFKRITYDFPESKWAAYARSQLSEPQMIRLDQKLEIERLEAGQ